MLPGLHKAALSLHPLRLLFLPKGGRMQSASVKWIGEQKFVATSPSGHAITLDSDRESNQAPGPMELLLMALGACTATDVVIILEKKRQKLDSLEIICSGERAKQPPAVWSKLEILYRLRGQLDDTAVRHAIQLSKTNTARSPQCSGKRPRCPGATRFWPLLPEPAWSAPDLLHP